MQTAIATAVAIKYFVNCIPEEHSSKPCCGLSWFTCLASWFPIYFSEGLLLKFKTTTMFYSRPIIPQELFPSQYLLRHPTTNTCLKIVAVTGALVLTGTVERMRGMKNLFV